MLEQTEVDELRSLYANALKLNSPESMRALVEEAAIGMAFGKLIEEAAALGLDFSAVADEGTVIADDIVGTSSPKTGP